MAGAIQFWTQCDDKNIAAGIINVAMYVAVVKVMLVWTIGVSFQKAYHFDNVVNVMIYVG